MEFSYTISSTSRGQSDYSSDSDSEEGFVEEATLYRKSEILNQVVSNCPTVLNSSVAHSKPITIFEKLASLYLKQFQHIKNGPYKSTQKLCSNLLSKLVQRDSLNTMVVHLKPLNQGYSVVMDSIETINLAYDETELLDFIDREEIPHMLTSILENARPDYFYDGCIIAEIRDSRRSSELATFKSSYILLKPNALSLLADINSIAMSSAANGIMLSPEDRLTLESKLILETSPPLCLEANPCVAFLENRMRHKRRAIRSNKILKASKPYSLHGALRKKLYNQLPVTDQLPVFNFLQRERTVPRPLQRSAPIDWWLPFPGADVKPVVSVDASDALKYAKELDKPIMFSGGKLITDCSPIITDEFMLETERPPGKLHKVRLIISRRPSEENYLGELHISRSDWNEARCAFELGPLPLVEKYIDKFIELFTEEGRRQVKITRCKPGQPPKTIMTSNSHAQLNQLNSPTIRSVLSPNSPNEPVTNPTQLRFISSPTNRVESPQLKFSQSSEGLSGDSSGNSLLGRRGLPMPNPVLRAQLSPGDHSRILDQSNVNSSMLAQISNAVPSQISKQGGFVRLPSNSPHIQILPSDTVSTPGSITLQNVKLSSLPSTSLAGNKPIILSAASHPAMMPQEQQRIQLHHQQIQPQQMTGLIQAGRSIVMTSHSFVAATQGLISLAAGTAIAQVAGSATRVLPTATILPTPTHQLLSNPSTGARQPTSVYLGSLPGSGIRFTQIATSGGPPIRTAQLTQQQLNSLVSRQQLGGPQFLTAAPNQQVRNLQPTRLQISPQHTMYTKFHLRSPNQGGGPR